MKKFEVCIVSKEYRWIEVEAEDDTDAWEKTWDKISDGIVGDIKPDDWDTEVYVENEVSDEVSE